VPLLKSLFCYFGSDNRSRFAIICLSCHVFFILFSTIFSSTFTSLCLILLTGAILSLTTQRRLKDANLSKNWLHLPNAIFIFISLIVIIVDNSATYWLLLLSLATYSLLLTYRSIAQKNYIVGYSGPIDLSIYQKVSRRNQRIEPSLSLNTNKDMKSNNVEIPSQQTFTANSSSDTEFDIGEAIREVLFRKKNSKLAFIFIISSVGIAMLVSFLLSEPTNENSKIVTNKPATNQLTSTQTRSNKITLADDFSLMSSEFDGIIINWPADTTTETEIWNINSAIGDKSCQKITFNNNDEIRTIRVIVEDGENYFALFSPLDSTKIIKNIALRSSFGLCGYKFSLKGSQAVLGKNSYYADIIGN